MKKLLLLFIIFSFSKTKAQIVFCPPGAEWHYNFGKFSTLYQEKIKYERDSILASDTVKVLSHTRFHMSCAFAQPLLTLIKQKGDTVFFKNAYTQNTWQILYNFAAQVGQGWQVTILRVNGPVTLSFNIFSIDYVNINNVSLKRISYGTSYITERIGANAFLFPFLGGSSCDNEYIAGMLCYQDNAFGLKQFTSLPCDFQGTVGFKEYGSEVFKLYPNPTSGLLRLKIENQDLNSELKINVVNLTGEMIVSYQAEETKESEIELDLKKLTNGIYFLQVFQKEKLIGIKKIIKE